MNKVEMTFQVRFDKEVANKLVLSEDTTILGGELVAIDFQGCRFKNIHSKLSFISVDEGLPEPIDTSHELRNFNQKLLVRYSDGDLEDYQFGFAWPILAYEDDDIEPDHVTDDGFPFYFELVDPFSGRVKVTHWMYLPNVVE